MGYGAISIPLIFAESGYSALHCAMRLTYKEYKRLHNGSVSGDDVQPSPGAECGIGVAARANWRGPPGRADIAAGYDRSGV